MADTGEVAWARLTEFFLEIDNLPQLIATLTADGARILPERCNMFRGQAHGRAML